MIKTTEIGGLIANHEELVFFSLDDVIQIANRLKIPVDELVDTFNGVQFPAPSVGYSVNKCHVIDNDGEVHDVALIGADPEKFVRFLKMDEPSFEEFLKAHPDYCIMGEGKFFNEEVHDEIRAEYELLIKSIIDK